MRKSSFLAAAAVLVLPSLTAAQPGAPTPQPTAPAPAPESPAPPAPPADSAAPGVDAPPTAPPTAAEAEPVEAEAPSEAEAPPLEAEPTPAEPTDSQAEPSDIEDSSSVPDETLPPAPEAPGAEESTEAPPAVTPPPPPPTNADTVFAEDWWSHTRPIIELHGYFRTRAELFNNFFLGRREAPGQSMWTPPPDFRYSASNATEYGPRLCAGSETDSAGSGESDDPSRLYPCDNQTQAGANLRLRFNPEVHVSDNLRVKGQIDLLDNLVMGSTPDGYHYSQGAMGTTVQPRSGYNQVGYYDSTQLPPDSSSNSFSDSVRVKRAWGEYSTPVGEARFGRMPHHWGLGMLYNSGDGYDDDYQSTVDRLQFTTKLTGLNLSIGAMWDFPNEGVTGSIPIPGAQPYDRASLDDVNQYGLQILYQKNPQLEKLALSRGNVVVNAGFYLLYRTQLLANDQPLSGSNGGAVPNADPDRLAQDVYARRDAETFVPNLWFQLKYEKFRFEFEAASVFGSVASTSIGSNDTGSTTSAFADDSAKVNLRQYGFAAELEQKLIEDRLRLGFKFGWASGDPDSYDPTIPGNLVPGSNEVQIEDNTLSTFRFHPSYRVDLILNRNLLHRIQGTYYFRPSVEYDFLKHDQGQRAGGGIQAIWTRATEFVQTPGHQRDLGIELNGTLYFQSKDGGLNDTPDAMGGFYAALQYGVLFPFDGMGYQVTQPRTELTAAQLLRLYLGVMF